MGIPALPGNQWTWQHFFKITSHLPCDSDLGLVIARILGHVSFFNEFMILFYLCFENDIHSRVQMFAEYYKRSVLFVVWCYNTSTHKSNAFEILCQI